MKSGKIFPKSVEVLVLGGGIHGVGVFHDLISRGLTDVCLVEKSKLASGTSSKSTKLIHGGLRYLQRLSQVPMVFESLQERKFLLSVASEIVKPIEILIPLLKSDYMNRAKIKIGLEIYDYLAKNSLIEPHKKLSLSEIREKIPFLKEVYEQKVFSYWDAQTDDRLLVNKVAQSALSFGGILFEQTKVCRLEDKKDHWDVTVVTKDGRKKQIKAKYIINCLGPWANKFLKSNKIEPTHEGVHNKGVHFLLKDIGLKSGLLLETGDKRKIFVLPWKNKTLIGTTEREYKGPLDKVEASDEEIDYLIKSCNEYFKIPIKRNQIESSFAGLRWLAVEKNQSISSTSRESIFGVIKNQRGFILTIYGGKLTSYRLLSEKVGDLITKDRKNFSVSQTKNKKYWV